MGIEQATERVREIRAMTSEQLGLPTAPDGATSAKFAATLDAHLRSVAPQSASATAPSAAQFQAAGNMSSQALAIEAMLPPASVAATAPPSMLTGDVDGLAPKLRVALEQVARQLNRTIDVASGLRTRAEQSELYRSYLAGTGNLAAPPGSSRHETGNAADVYIDGVGLASVPGGREAAQAAGLGFPVGGEDWHAELMG